MQLIDGTSLANEIYTQLQTRLNGRSKRLAIVVATDNQAAHTYVALKQKQAQALGLTVDIVNLPQQTTFRELVDRIGVLGGDRNIDGIMVQLPLFTLLQPQSALLVNLIPPEKDVDGLTAFTQGSISQNLRPYYLPATVAAVLESLRKAFAPATDFLNLDFSVLEPSLRGKNVVIINHSNLVGKPLAAALINLNATVTVAHEFTTNLPALTQAADIVISATGRPGLITAEMLKAGSTVVDVTSVRTEAGIRGDVVVTPELEAKVAWLTPVPGGIGPLTVACLLRNLVLGPLL